MTVFASSHCDQSDPTRRRYLALWLPLLPTERLQRSGGAQDEEPFVVVDKLRGALRLYACDAKAAALGLTPGLTLAEARARLPQLAAAQADLYADARLAEDVAAWCEQFTPLVALDAPHGVILDITGCAHLFGGEERMRALIMQRLARFGLTARAALAQTPDAARAFARFGGKTSGKATSNARELPIAALEASHETTVALMRAGLATLDDLAARPSSALAARFGMALVTKLDRILGLEDRRITPIRAPAPYLVERRFAEPLLDLAGIEPAMRYLFDDAARLLEQHGEGGRAFEIVYFRTDGVTRRLLLETGHPSRDAGMLLRLYREKIGALADPLDPGFGFDLIRLAVTRSEKYEAQQKDLDGAGRETELLDALIDRLAARFGRERVLRFATRDSHDPLRASAYVYFDTKTTTSWAPSEPDEPPLRPLSLFEPPQPIETMAQTPDGTPIHFRWRRVQHIVARAEGPERIAPEWWRKAHNPEKLSDFSDQLMRKNEQNTRDYYRVEDRDGRRFWIYREGLYERETSRPRWFLHGLFA